MAEGKSESECRRDFVHGHSPVARTTKSHDSWRGEVSLPIRRLPEGGREGLGHNGGGSAIHKVRMHEDFYRWSARRRRNISVRPTTNCTESKIEIVPLQI